MASRKQRLNFVKLSMVNLKVGWVFGGFLVGFWWVFGGLVVALFECLCALDFFLGFPWKLPGDSFEGVFVVF